MDSTWNSPEAPVVTSGTGVARRPQSTGTFTGTPAGLIPAYDDDVAARTWTVSRPLRTLGLPVTAERVPTWEGVACHDRSSARGTGEPSTSKREIVIRPCIASPRAPGPPRLIVSSGQPFSQLGSRTVDVDVPTG